VSPRVFRLVALPAPSGREKRQMYFQRYLTHLPAGREIVIFDRSWYNLAGVKRVMGFCTDAQYRRVLDGCPQIEGAMLEPGIQLIKYGFEVSMEEQARRFEDRIADDRKLWKLSPMDLESHRHHEQPGRFWIDQLINQGAAEGISPPLRIPTEVARGDGWRQQVRSRRWSNVGPRQLLARSGTNACVSTALRPLL
jgi:hypothetical protein